MIGVAPSFNFVAVCAEKLCVLGGRSGNYYHHRHIRKDLTEKVQKKSAIRC